jgi:F-type H+-transporting ATPase subunit a
MKKLLAALALIALTFPVNAMASSAEGKEEEFNPEHEFELDAWVPIEIGPIDMSINKAVVYLWLGAAVTMTIGIVLMRLRVRVDPTTRQTAGETIYDIVQTQIAEQGLPHRAIGRWFPYVATLFLFVWSVNMLGFLPLPLTGETYHVAGLEIPVWGIYAATSSISVTLALALMTFVFTHIEGVRENGPVRYVKSWIPEVPRALLGPIAFIEILSQFMRLISLSVRLYANMLAGHMLILTFIGLIFVAGTAFTAIGLVPLATLFYLFEVVIVVNIQAFIFAALSAIYIGSAIEPEH